MIRTILIVGSGGFIGSVMRYLSQVLVEKLFHSTFPWGTFFVNILGSLIIGMVYELAEKGNYLNAEWRLFLAVGVCGGFTTFSAFTYNNLMLIKDQSTALLLFNVFGSIVLGVLAVYLGIIFIRTIV